MELKSIYLTDQSLQLSKAWTEAFALFPEVNCSQGDYFNIRADAMVSPANSFGFMDGGLDLAIRDRLGAQIEFKVRDIILSKYHGEMPVGMAEIIETGNSSWPFLICAPTMRVPESVERTLNSYLSFRAILLAVRRHNETSVNPIRNFVCPGLATGIGKMPARRCAAQMRAAYYFIKSDPTKLSFKTVHEAHFRMLSI